MEVEKRRHPRVEVKLPVTMTLPSEFETLTAEVGNLAPGGILVRSAASPAPGAEVEFCFRMIANRECRARGRVAWQNNIGFGIAFDDTNDDMDRFTAQLLKLPSHLHLFYLADVLHPVIHVSYPPPAATHSA